MKTLKENGSAILTCLFEIIIGILLLLNPIAFTTGIIIACGIVLLLLGVRGVVRYFRMDPVTAVQTQELAKALLLLALGAFCVFRYQWFILTFPVLAVIYGVLLLVTGLVKIQWAVDLLRMKKGRWFLAAVSAVISIVCAVVILRNPFTSSAVLWIFTGISLIVEAVLDLVTLFLNNGKRKDTVDAESAEEVPDPGEEQVQ